MGGQWKCFMNTYKIGKDGKTNVLNQKKKKKNLESSMNGIY